MNNHNIENVLVNNSTIFFGVVTKVRDGIAIIKGLDNAKAGEVLEFASGVKGLALNLSHSEVSAVIFGNERLIKEGVRVKNTGKLMTIGVSSNLLGRVINVLGESLDDNNKLNVNKFVNVEQKAVGIIARQSVHEPMLTGLKALDSLIPIGRGQRELIIGDRQTGKTAIALDTIINQKKINESVEDKDKMYCIWER